MPKSTKPYVIFYIDGTKSAPILVHEMIGDEVEAKARYGELAAKGNTEIIVWHNDAVIPVEIETQPRVVFGSTHKPLAADKPRRKRRTKAQMEAARANGEEKPKKANGADTTVAQ